VADARTQRDGKNLAEIGIYDPTKDPTVLQVDLEAAKKWISDGAQPTEKVRALLKKSGL
jgi:small subunit ribosomal protein S16